jgi:regulator of replication initiation timing
MTIRPRPDQEAKIQEAMHAGLIHSAEEALDVGLESLQKRLSDQANSKQAQPQMNPQAKRRTQGSKSLVELFAESPFKGLNLEFERDKDVGRDINL